VGDDGEWEGLRRALGCPSWADDPALSDGAGRRAGHDLIDRHLAAWTAERSKWEAFERCRAQGVPAGPVLDEAELLADPQLSARGFFRPNGSDDVGRHLFPGHLWHWDGPALAWGPVNRMGADNAYVYRQVLGVTDEEWAALAAEGHLSLDYVDGDGRPL
jgi:crotonobetainyl-CoA:carnitine CoA-transferase CaiB-like acyl-CoA transferase